MAAFFVTPRRDHTIPAGVLLFIRNYSSPSLVRTAVNQPGRGASTVMRSPVDGWVKVSWAA